jgi:predicted nucleic acid-binding protein
MYREILVEEESILRAPQILLRTVEVNPKKKLCDRDKKNYNFIFRA